MYSSTFPSASISTLAVHERPQERLEAKGPAHLSDRELLALLLRTGRKGNDVFAIADAVCTVLDQHGLQTRMSELLKIPGVGRAKASILLAALEFARRRLRPATNKIREARDIFLAIRHLADRPQEQFVAITLNGANEILAVRTITTGLVNATQIHPREVFADAIVDRATGLVVAHNHPSGDLTPSEQDIRVTSRLLSAGELLGISLLDHIIFSTADYASLRNLGYIPITL